MKKALHLLLALIVSFGFVNAQNIVQVGVLYNFSQSPSSTTDYQLNLQAPGEITIHINNWISTLDWGKDYDRIYVYNNDGILVSREALSSEADPFLFHMFQGNTGLTFRLGQAGIYTIKVHSGEYEENDWNTTKVQNFEMSVTAIYCNDIHEPNDKMETASSIAIGDTITGFQWKQIKTSEIWGDEDWYKISIATPGILKIELVNWVGVYDWSHDYDRLYIYNANGVSIGKTGDYDFYSWMMGGGTDVTPVVTEMNLTHAGTYYLRYHAGEGTSTTPYHFSTSFIPANDPFEPNDNFSTAKMIPSSDVWYQAYEWRTLDSTMNVKGDEDYYSFVAAGAGQYSITLDGWIGIYNWGDDYDRIFIYDSNENIVGPNPLSWMMGNTPISFNIPSAGKYYILLHCGSGYSIDGYKFKLTGLITDVKEQSLDPSNFKLGQNTPNPFNSKTKINYTVPFNSEVRITVYNQIGKKIKELVNEKEALGNFELTFDASDLPNGIYFYSISAISSDMKHSYSDIKKMVLAR